MKPGKIDRSFARFLATANIDVASAAPSVGIDAMLKFYADERADGCDIAADEDMLLFQWGTYDWGQGERFELDLTRQVMLPRKRDDDVIWQLRLTYFYVPNESLWELGAANRWCHSPVQLAEFENFVKSSAPYAMLGGRRADSTDVTFQNAG